MTSLHRRKEITDSITHCSAKDARLYCQQIGISENDGQEVPATAVKLFYNLLSCSPRALQQMLW